MALHTLSDTARSITGACGVSRVKPRGGRTGHSNVLERNCIHSSTHTSYKPERTLKIRQTVDQDLQLKSHLYRLSVSLAVQRPRIDKKHNLRTVHRDRTVSKIL